MTCNLASAHGQTADASAPSAVANHNHDNIVVTANRRTTDIQKTALAISTIDAATLQNDSMVQLADINGRIPGLQITRTSGYETVVAIRGIGLGTPENELTTSPGVATFIDGVYIANSISLDETLFDLDHVEVLRGPAGALYGQSSTGGALLLVTRQPILGRFTGTATFTGGDYALHREQGELNVPLNDQIAIRVSAQNYGHAGFTRDALLPGNDLDDANDISGKIALLFKPVDTISATLTTQAYSAHQNGEAQKNISDPSPDPRVVDQDYPGHFALKNSLTHLNLEWDLPGVTIKSVTAYQYLNHRQQEDSSRSAFSVTGSYDDVAAWNTDLKNLNEELDIFSTGDRKFGWITGIFALNQNTRQLVAEFECPNAAQFMCSAPTPAQVTITPQDETSPPVNLVFGQDLRSHHRSFAWFAQGVYQIRHDLRLTAGARINYDSFGVASHMFGASTLYSEYSDVIPTWRGELAYDLSPQSMITISTARGYKPGGINTSNTADGEAIETTPTFKPESNIAFEVGSKNWLFGHSLRANFAVFYYLYKNMQYIATDPEEFAGGVENIPTTHIRGGEAELSYTGFQQRLHANGMISLESGRVEGKYYAIDSTIQQHLIATLPACMYGGTFYNPACFKAEAADAVNVAGNKPAQLPNILASFDISYDIPVPAGTLIPRIEFIHRGSFQQRIFNQSEVDAVPAYGLLNLAVKYIPSGTSRISVQISLTNAFDKAGINSRYTDPYGTFTTSQQFIPPRQIMGTVSYTFGNT